MDYDVCIIGGGPAGYLAGIRAAQLGAKTAVIEMDELGGVCTNRGCIPTKALLEVSGPLLLSGKWADMGLGVKCSLDIKQAMGRMHDVVGYVRAGIHALLDAHGVAMIKGRAQIIDRYTVGITLPSSGLSASVDEGVRTKSVLIATGSVPSMPDIQGAGHDTVLSSDGLFMMSEVPERVAIVGGGAIGIEYATILKSFGTKRVVLIEFMDRLLPFMDPAIGAYERDLMERLGIEVILSHKATKASKSGKGIRLEIVPASGSAQSGIGPLDVDKVFAVTGKKPNTAGLGLDTIGVSAPRGWVDVNRAMRTSVDNVYAAGDVNGIKLLAHAAFHQGMIAVENMLGQEKLFEPGLVPSVVYSIPPVAQVGMDEVSARKAGMDVKTGVFDLANNPMSLVHGDPSGFIKVLSDTRYGRVLGASIAGESAYELISVFALGIAGEVTLDELRRTVFAHPSLAEGIAESAWAVDGLSQHTISTKNGVQK